VQREPEKIEIWVNTRVARRRGIGSPAQDPVWGRKYLLRVARKIKIKHRREKNSARSLYAPGRLAVGEGAVSSFVHKPSK